MQIPDLGLGTWPMKGDACTRVVSDALDLGFRHIDTAQMYENEAEVGAAVKTASVPREDLFLVTKIHQDRFSDGTVRASAEQSLRDLGCDYVDMILCHWPPRDVPAARVVDALQKLKDAGLTRAIGVSNFNETQCREAADVAEIATNQVEHHPYLDQSRMRGVAAELGFPLTAYRPIVKGKVLEDPVVTEIAARLDREPVQVVLRWVIQHGVKAICNTTKRARLMSNLGALATTLSEQDMAAIDALGARNMRTCDLAEWSPDWSV